MKLNQLKYFVCIIDCQSFNQAAQKLFISQPALTNAIKTLENEIGQVLLQRTNKGVYPTEAGKQFYRDAQDVLAFFEQKMHPWLDTPAFLPNVSGKVSLSCLRTICSILMDKLFFDLQATYPHIDITLHETIGATIAEGILSGQANIEILSISLAENAQNKAKAIYQRHALNYYALLQDEYIIALSSRNPLAQKDCLAPEDLAGLTRATYSTMLKPTQKNLC